MAIVLAVTTLGGQIERADGYERVDRLIALNSDLRVVLDAVQSERDEVARLFNQSQPISSPELSKRRDAVDNSIAPMNRSAGNAIEADDRIQGRYSDVRSALDGLRSIRSRAEAGQLDATATVKQYTNITGALLNLDQAVISRASDGTIGGSANALHDLEVVKEELAVQKARLGVGLARGTMPLSDLVDLRTSDVRLNDRLGQFRAVASAELVRDYDNTVAGSQVETRNRLIRTVLGEQGGSVDNVLAEVTSAEWTAASDQAINRTDQVIKRVGDQLVRTSDEMQETASNATGLVAVLLFAAFVLAIAVVIVITRQLLRSLRLLRRGALEVADTQLPSAVQSVRDGQRVDDNVAPVAVHTKDEVGQVARAFDTLHRQALRLAIEQSTMRSGYSSVFVNLSRRSQSLVQRQLQLIEQLERDEEDSEQLSTLFQLDHLATRMRRNNENLMVLSGSEPGRRSGQPVAVSDLLRAAVSEIEQYQRVTVQPPPSVMIVGYAGSDLMRLVAELLDNATAFSAPETKVTVSSRLSEDGSVSVDVLDQGIGMSSDEVAEANERLASAGDVDTLSSRRMGLFVVGRLASRHDIRVQLHGGKDIAGVRATVIIPAELVVTSSGQSKATQESGSGGPGPGPAGGSTPPIPSQTRPPAKPGELPRRNRSVNGTLRHGALSDIMSGQQGVPEPAQGGQREPDALHGEPSPGDESAEQGAPAGFGDRPRRVDDDNPSGTDLFSPISDTDPDDAAAEPEPTPTTGPEQTRTTEHAGPAEGALQETAAGAGATAAPEGRSGDQGAEHDPAQSSALSDWWATTTRSSAGQAAAPKPEPARTSPESTPIFDEMLSAWFRGNTTVQPDEAPAGRDPATTATSTGQWSFAADAGWQTVESVSRSAPSSYTPAGLPRRVRGEKLMPGTASASSASSAETATEAAGSEGPSGLPRRNAQDVRGRLSSFQQGVSRGRGESKHARPEQSRQPDAGSVFQPEQPEQPGTPEQPGAQPGQPGTPGQLGALGRTRSAAEQPVTPPPPTDHPPTSARHESTETSDTGTRFTTAAWPTAEQADAQPAPASHTSQSPSGDSMTGTLGAPASEEEWSFAADAGWRAVESVSQSAPSSFTASGLPRRVRGEQLLPGSAAAESVQGTSAAVRTEQDAQNVRGRLSSFQQGIRRGRHYLAQQPGGNDEESGG
ncbi:MAG: HAMP domain-containing protein [Pseudonocardiaceae bacterium]|nr:HAMP domain-containing protein [Pseudonocardiaceae bacterium]